MTSAQHYSAATTLRRLAENTNLAAIAARENGDALRADGFGAERDQLHALADHHLAEAQLRAKAALDPAPTLAPEGYRADAQGRLVPLEHIKEIDQLRDALVCELVALARPINAALAAYRDRAFNDIQAFAQLSAERFGAKLGGRKGNLTLVSFCGRYKIQRAISDQLVFDERLQAAKALIDACINDWAGGSRSELRVLINGAFQVDQAGKIDTHRVLELRRYDITDERWKQAMAAISESLRVASSRSYLRLYIRSGNADKYVPLNLDLANA